MNLLNVVLTIALLALLISTKIPALQGFLVYGKQYQLYTPGTGIIHQLAKLKVPKAWFTHFYILDLIESLFLLLHLRNMLALMAFIQACRRLYESLTLFNKSKAQMHLSHYILGYLFYIVVNYNILNSQSHTNLLLVLVFIVLNIDQYQNHLYLSRLTKYNLPRRAMFKYTCNLHYLDEVIIYFVQFCSIRNTTSFLIWLWVLLSLGISANATYNLYVQKGYKVTYRLMPFIY